MEVRAEEIFKVLSGDEFFFDDLRPTFEETPADRLYNLLREKANLYPILQPINMVLFQSGKIDDAHLPLLAGTQQTNKTPNPGEKRPGVDIEQGSSKRSKSNNPSEDTLAQVESGKPDPRAREASPITTGTSGAQKQKDREPQTVKTLPTLRSGFKKLSAHAAGMGQLIEKLQEAQERTEMRQLAKNEAQDAANLKKIAALESDLQLKSEDIDKLQKENKKLEQEQSSLETQQKDHLSLLEDERQENAAMKVAQSSGIAEWRIQRSELTTEIEELKAIIRALQYSP